MEVGAGEEGHRHGEREGGNAVCTDGGACGDCGIGRADAS